MERTLIYMKMSFRDLLVLDFSRYSFSFAVLVSIMMVYIKIWDIKKARPVFFYLVIVKNILPSVKRNGLTEMTGWLEIDVHRPLFSTKDMTSFQSMVNI